MTTPFDKLQAYYGPDGVGAMRLRYHEEEQAWDLPDIKFLDTEHPLFKALWEVQAVSHSMINGGAPFARYLPRSRAEAATELWAASRPLFMREGWSLRALFGTWQICSDNGRVVVAESAIAEDALSAAILRTF